MLGSGVGGEQECWWLAGLCPPNPQSSGNPLRDHVYVDLSWFLSPCCPQINSAFPGQRHSPEHLRWGLVLSGSFVSISCLREWESGTEGLPRLTFAPKLSGVGSPGQDDMPGLY